MSWINYIKNKYTPPALLIIKDVCGMLTDEQAKEFLRGGEVVVPLSYYDKWKALGGYVAGVPQSHESKKEVLHWCSDYFPTVLVGTREENAWVQLEGHDVHQYPLQHLIDYIIYWFTNNNQGPDGSTSRFTESRPLYAPGTKGPETSNRN